MMPPAVEIQTWSSTDLYSNYCRRLKRTKTRAAGYQRQSRTGEEHLLAESLDITSSLRRCCRLSGGRIYLNNSKKWRRATDKMSIHLFYKLFNRI